MQNKLPLAFTVILMAIIAVLGVRTVIDEEEAAPPAAHDADSHLHVEGTPSEAGTYLASYTPATEPLPLNQLHSWTLHLMTADGQPVENATITVDGGMPGHGHGLPTQPEVKEYLGDGNYRVDGLRFNMPGAWVLNFHIEAADQTDEVVFEFNVE